LPLSSRCRSVASSRAVTSSSGGRQATRTSGSEVMKGEEGLLVQVGETLQMSGLEGDGLALAVFLCATV
jgi:hypothetical protein